MSSPLEVGACVIVSERRDGTADEYAGCVGFVSLISGSGTAARIRCGRSYAWIGVYRLSPFTIPKSTP